MQYQKKEEEKDAGEDWGPEKELTEEGIVEWYHCLRGHDFEQTPGDSKGQGNLVGYSPRGHRGLHTP